MALLPLTLTLLALHLAMQTLRVSVPSQCFSTCKPHMKLLAPVSCWEQRTPTCKNDYLNPVMSELCVISCSGLLAKWSHLSGKKAMVAAGTKLTPAVWDCEKGRKHDPSTCSPTLFEISDPAVANSCTVLSAPQNRYPRCQLMKSKCWCSVAGFYCIVPTTPYHYSTPEQLYGRVILHPKKLRISIKTHLH